MNEANLAEPNHLRLNIIAMCFYDDARYVAGDNRGSGADSSPVKCGTDGRNFGRDMAGIGQLQSEV